MLPGLADAEIVVEPSPASGASQSVRGRRSHVDRSENSVATFHARLRAVQQLQSRGIGYRDTGDLLDLHVHRVLRLLTHSELQRLKER